MSFDRKSFKLRESYPYFLANKPVYANAVLEVTNKYTNQVATRVSLADAKVIDEAIAAAVQAQEKLKEMHAYERKEIILQLVAGMKERRDELACALAIEAGKPIKDSYGEVDRAILTFSIAAEEAVRMYGEYAPLDISAGNKEYVSITRNFPIGPVSMISPFNFPINLAAHKIAPALAVGVPWVLKPASRTPIGALLMGEILSKTNLPPGAFSILPVDRNGADLFTTDDRFKLVSFTGSPQVGWEIKSKAGKKKVVLELGGNAACVIDEGTDVNDAVERCVFGAFYQSGQSCISVQRIYVHSSLYDEFISKFVEATRKLKSGDPLDDNVFLGPMITEGEAKRLESWINEALQKGGKLLSGGQRNGAMLEATVVENVPKGTNLRDEEAFGPVVCVEKFTDFKDVVQRVNDSKFGLQCGVFTKDLNRAWYAFDHVEAGGVLINDVPSKRIDSQAYGGVKESGLGREGIRYAMQDMVEPKVLIMRNAGKI